MARGPQRARAQLAQAKADSAPHLLDMRSRTAPTSTPISLSWVILIVQQNVINGSPSFRGENQH